MLQMYSILKERLSSDHICIKEIEVDIEFYAIKQKINSNLLYLSCYLVANKWQIYFTLISIFAKFDQWITRHMLQKH